MTDANIAAAAAPKVAGVHHSAFRCRDAAETRAFYEGILGLRMKAALAFDKDPAGQPRPYMHLFFEMADGNFIAFFDLPHTVDEAKFGVKDGMEEFHVAMEVADRDALMAFKKRLQDHGVPVYGPIDHHFCHSIYFYDPNGINLEFTIRDAKHDQILIEEEQAVDRIMTEWSATTAAIRSARLKDQAGQREEHETAARNRAALIDMMLTKAQKATA